MEIWHEKNKRKNNYSRLKETTNNILEVNMNFMTPWKGSNESTNNMSHRMTR